MNQFETASSQPTRRLVAPAIAAGEIAANDGLARGSDSTARILVIDDNATVLESFRKILGGDAAPPDELEALDAALFGAQTQAPWHAPRFEVDLVTDGEQGCDRAFRAKLEVRPYAVAFVDMRMPGGWDGLKTIEELWRADAAIQVVICTAYSDHTWSEVLQRLGRSDRLLVLRKPFEPIEVQQLACALSQKWQLQRQQEAQLAALECQVEARVGDLRRANRTLRMLSRCNEARGCG